MLCTGNCRKVYKSQEIKRQLSTRNSRHKKKEDSQKKMAQKVAKVGVKKTSGYLYFVDKRGDVSRAKMARGRKKGKAGKPERVAKVGVKKESGYLYFIDKAGDISRAKMARGGRKRKAKKTVAKKKKPSRKKAAKSKPSRKKASKKRRK